MENLYELYMAPATESTTGNTDEVALEGANLETFKLKFGPARKEAVKLMKAGHKAARNKQYEDARGYYEEAKKKLQELKSAVLAIPDSAFSTVLSYLIEMLPGLAYGAGYIGSARATLGKEGTKAVAKSIASGAVIGIAANVGLGKIMNKGKDADDTENLTKRDFIMALDKLIKTIDKAISKLPKENATPVTEEAIRLCFEQLIPDIYEAFNVSDESEE